jgi:hypothetical protein
MNIKTKVLSLTAAAIIGVAGTVGVVGLTSAQEPTATPPQPKNEQRIQRRDDFLSKVAAKLNITLDELKQAFKSVAIQAVDDALAGGKITQSQADAAKTKIENGNGLGLGGLLGRQVRRDAFAARLRAGIVKSSATALNMTPAQLRTELKSGKSIADVAGANLPAVKTQITTDAKTKLDAAVTANKLTQAQADKLLAALTGNLDKLLAKTRGQKEQDAAPLAP